MSDLGWPPAYSGKARMDQIIKNLSDKDLQYRYLSPDDGDLVQAVSDYLVRYSARLIIIVLTLLNHRLLPSFGHSEAHCTHRVMVSAWSSG